MYTEECCSVSKCEFDGGVHGHHVRSHPCRIRTGLNDESLECDALEGKRRNLIPTHLRILQKKMINSSNLIKLWLIM